MNNKLLLTSVIVSVFTGLPSLTTAASINIESGSGEGTRNCTYSNILIDSAGVASLKLNNFACLSESSDGSCKLDGKILSDGNSSQFWLDEALTEFECGETANSGTRTCNSGSLEGDQKYKLRTCKVKAEDSCTDANQNVITHNQEEFFYTSSSVSCATSDKVKRTCEYGDLSGDSKYGTMDCKDSNTGSGLVDSGYYNQNVSYSRNSPLIPQLDPDTGYKVFIIDQGAFDTAIPSCVNGESVPSACASKNSWDFRMKTDEVWSVRIKTKQGYTGDALSFDPLQFGGNVDNGSFDYVLATKPGVMESDIKGRCEFRDVSSARMRIISGSKYDSASSGVQTLRCRVEEDTLVYLNVRAVNSSCDTSTANCNSYITPSSGLVD